MMKWFFLLMLFLSTAISPAQAQEWTTSPVVITHEEYVAPRGFITVEGPYVRIHGHADREELLLRLSRHAAKRARELSDELNVPIGGEINVLLVRSNEEFRRLQPSKSPSWADAVAYPGKGLIFLRDPSIRIATDEPLEMVFDHELVHILLGRAFAPAHPPAWLQEGVAQIMAHQDTAELNQVFVKGLGLRGVIPLEDLALGFPRDAERARFAYAESANFIGYLMRTYGADIVAKLIEESRKGGNFHAIIRNTTGDLFSTVESNWRAEHAPGFTLTLGTLMSSEVLWGFCGVLLIIGGVTRRREYHRRVQAMFEEEALLDELLSKSKKAS